MHCHQHTRLRWVGVGECVGMCVLPSPPLAFAASHLAHARSYRPPGPACSECMNLSRSHGRRLRGDGQGADPTGCAAGRRGAMLVRVCACACACVHTCVYMRVLGQAALHAVESLLLRCPYGAGGGRRGKGSKRCAALCGAGTTPPPPQQVLPRLPPCRPTDPSVPPLPLTA